MQPCLVEPNQIRTLKGSLAPRTNDVSQICSARTVEFAAILIAE